MRASQSLARDNAVYRSAHCNQADAVISYHLRMQGEVCRVAGGSWVYFSKELWDDATQPIDKKTTMHKKKNLTNQSNSSANRLTIKDMPAELIELSDEALSQVWGCIKPADPDRHSPAGQSGGGTQAESPLKKWIDKNFF